MDGREDDPRYPIREGIGCLLQGLAVAVVLIGYAVAEYIWQAAR